MISEKPTLKITPKMAPEAKSEIYFDTCTQHVRWNDETVYENEVKYSMWTCMLVTSGRDNTNSVKPRIFTEP